MTVRKESTHAMKRVFRLFTILFATVLGGCEEEESPLLFSTTENKFPQNVKIEYFSPDPSCVPKGYFITANRLKGELVIKCTNAKQLYFSEIGDYPGIEYGLTTSGEKDRNTLVYKKGSWQVSLVDNNTLRFCFSETDMPYDSVQYVQADCVNVSAKDKNKVLETGIMVFRNLQSDKSVD